MFRRKLIILSILIGIFTWFEASSWAVPMEDLIPKENLPEGWGLIEGPQTFTKKTLLNISTVRQSSFLSMDFKSRFLQFIKIKKTLAIRLSWIFMIWEMWFKPLGSSQGSEMKIVLQELDWIPTLITIQFFSIKEDTLSWFTLPNRIPMS